jgi:outer membrane protein assembly factor BamB
MFHVKQRRVLGLLALAGLLAVLGAGCVSRVGTRGWAGPVHAGNVLIVSSGGGRIDGIGSDDRQEWRFPEMWNISERKAQKLKGIYGPPVVSADGKVVFVGDYNGYVYAFRPGEVNLDAQNDDQKPPAASLKLDGPVIGGITLDSLNNKLYATSKNRVYSMSASDLVNRIDKPAAQIVLAILYEATDDIWSAPVLSNGEVLFSSLDGNLYAVDPVSGAEKWRFEAGKGLVATSVVGDLVFTSGFGSTLFAVDVRDGSEKWSFKASHWIWAKPAVSQGLAYVGDFDGVVHAVALADGVESWSLALDKGPLRASPAISGGTLVISTADGWLFGIDTSSHEIVWQRDVGTALDADITVDGGSVYIAPKGCATPESGGDKLYYTQVNPSNGDLTSATGVC